eukprot:10348763-Prorocentrum_lima.AAC.1
MAHLGHPIPEPTLEETPATVTLCMAIDEVLRRPKPRASKVRRVTADATAHWRIWLTRAIV